ncbi:MAG: F0F1-type ATP synthase assembly protein I [Hyphomicrobiaceae bacterium]
MPVTEEDKIESPAPADEAGGEVDQRQMRAAAVAWHLGWPIAGGVVLGSWIDGKLGTAPWLTLLICMGGFVGAVRRIIVLSRPQPR